MMAKMKQWLPASLAALVVLAVAVTGVVVYHVMKDNPPAVTGQTDSTLAPMTLPTESSGGEKTAEQLRAWADYVPEVTWSADDTEAGWDESTSTRLLLDGSAVTVSGDESAVSCTRSAVTIQKAGTYVLRGSLTDCQIVVNAPEKALVRLVFDGVVLNHSGAAPIHISQAGKVVLILAPDSQNSVADQRPERSDDDLNAALYSQSDLAITGSGQLAITTIWSDGINARDRLWVSQAVMAIDSGDDGILGRDLLAIAGGQITITSGGDGLRSSNADSQESGHIAISGGIFNITAGGDAIQAAGQLLVTGGIFTLTTGEGSSQALAERPAQDVNGFPGGGRGRMPGNPFGEPIVTEAEDTTPSMKALKAAVAVKISGGTLYADAADDAVHSDGIIQISAGQIELASGDDGIHADSQVTINGGTVTISRSYEGIESKTILLSGGDLHVTALDDGINVVGDQGGGAMGGRPGSFPSASSDGQTLEIAGAILVVDAQGDGLDINGTVSMSAGSVTVYGPSADNNSALDYDGTFTLTGGTLLAVGSAGMAQSVSSTSQSVLAFTTRIDAETKLVIADSSGRELASVTAPRAISAVVYSSPELTGGTTYTISSEGTVLGQITP